MRIHHHRLEKSSIFSDEVRFSGPRGFWYRNTEVFPTTGPWVHVFDYTMALGTANRRIALQNANTDQNWYFIFGSNVSGGNTSERFVKIDPQNMELSNNTWTHIAITWQINAAREATVRLLLNGNVRGSLFNVNNFSTFADTTPEFPNRTLVLGSQTFSSPANSNISSYFAQVAYFPNKVLTKDEIDAIIYVFLP